MLRNTITASAVIFAASYCNAAEPIGAPLRPAPMPKPSRRNPTRLSCAGTKPRAATENYELSCWHIIRASSHEGTKLLGPIQARERAKIHDITAKDCNLRNTFQAINALRSTPDKHSVFDACRKMLQAC